MLQRHFAEKGVALFYLFLATVFFHRPPSVLLLSVFICLWQARLWAPILFMNSILFFFWGGGLADAECVFRIL